MEQIAWQLDVDKSGIPVGFTPPQEDEDYDLTI
jgi:hypothetical protein